MLDHSLPVSELAPTARQRADRPLRRVHDHFLQQKVNVV